jgi:hypothetical protein
MSNQEPIPPPRSTAELAGRPDHTEPRASERDERAPGGDDRSRGAARDDRSRGAGSEEQAPLLSSSSSSGFSTRWQDVQAKFVDEPREAVREADGLVAEVIQTLAGSFADQRHQLEEQWSKGSEVSTEDLRQALMQYRSFFQRLLAA